MDSELYMFVVYLMIFLSVLCLFLRPAPSGREVRKFMNRIKG
jgi:hypothetical protein